MIYQPLQLGEPPYYIGYRENAPFPVHKHYEIELFYCVEGKYDIIINHEEYILNEGELAIIGSMIPHELPETNFKYDSTCLVIEVGPTMLGEHFSHLENEAFPDPIFNLNLPEHKQLGELLAEANMLRKSNSQFSSLAQKGNVYKICAYIFENFVKSNSNSNATKKVTAIMNIENCLDYIYTHYNEKLTIEDVASICGYSKSNFCKIFKSITDKTFHNVLNTHRVKVATVLLKNSTFSIEEISTKVGFSDAKSFCRIFKEIKGVTPGTYRKNKKHN